MLICYSESLCNYLHIYFILACGPPVIMCHVSLLSTCICLPRVAYYVRLGVEIKFESLLRRGFDGRGQYETAI